MASAPKKSTKQASTSASNAVAAVWQWVCYGLWELALIALSVLLVATLSYFFIDNGADYTFSLYFMAAVLCLLPPAYVVDRRYSLQEPAEKHGFAAVIMVLNAVVVFIATIGAFITAVMTALSVLIDGDASAPKTIAIVSALVVAVLGGMLFVRIIQPDRLARLTRYFRQLVAAVAAVTLIAAVAGPVVNMFQTRQDRLIEQNLVSLQNAIENYVNEKRALPASLDDLELSGGYYDRARQLVDRKLVTYIPESTKAGVTDPGQGISNQTIYHYRLCATFERARGDEPTRFSSSETYTYLYDPKHPAGYHCFELRISTYN